MDFVSSMMILSGNVDVEDKEWGGIEGIFNTWADDCIEDFYCFVVVRVVIRVMPYFVSLFYVVVVSFWMFHLSDGVNFVH